MVRNGDVLTEPNLIELSSTDDLELVILNEPFAVVYNLPRISEVGLPSSILASYYVYPYLFKMLFCNRNETIFKWYKGEKVNLVIY